MVEDLLAKCPLDKVSLKECYDIIKSELKLPTVWSDSFENYLLFIKIKNGCNSLNKTANKLGAVTSVCNACVMIAYKHLFRFILSNLATIKFSKWIGALHKTLNKKDLGRMLESYRLYLECYAEKPALIT